MGCSHHKGVVNVLSYITGVFWCLRMSKLSVSENTQMLQKCNKPVELQMCKICAVPTSFHQQSTGKQGPAGVHRKIICTV